MLELSPKMKSRLHEATSRAFHALQTEPKTASTIEELKFDKLNWDLGIFKSWGGDPDRQHITYLSTIAQMDMEVLTLLIDVFTEEGKFYLSDKVSFQLLADQRIITGTIRPASSRVVLDEN